MGHTNLQSHLGYKTSNIKAHFWACFPSFLSAFLQSLWNYCSLDFALSWQGKWSLLLLLLVLRGTVLKHLFAGTAVSLQRAVIIPSISSLTWNWESLCLYEKRLKILLHVKHLLAQLMQRLCQSQWTCAELAAWSQGEPCVPVDKHGQPLCSWQQIPTCTGYFVGPFYQQDVHYKEGIWLFYYYWKWKSAPCHFLWQAVLCSIRLG